MSKLQHHFAIAVGRFTYWVLHTFRGGGSALPGKLAARIAPDVLTTLRAGRPTIIVTGTNGKTLTTNLIVRVLKAQYDDILTNATGSNMMQGIITAYLAHKPAKSAAKRIAVLEVDEANVASVAAALDPQVFVMTNIFRDQMDRYGEFYATYQKILDGVTTHPNAVVIANGDAPIFSSRELPNRTRYYGFELAEDAEKDELAPPNTDGVLCPVCEHILHYHGRTYANLGDFFCPNCGFKRPALANQVTAVTEQTPTTASFAINDQAITLPIGGTYNIYNALAAYTVGAEFGISPVEITGALNAAQQVFGRQEVVALGGKTVTLILVKNPVGLNEVLTMIQRQTQPFALAILLNANYADGIDTSWIWDGNFEQLVASDPNRTYMVGGERYRDIAFRMQVAGVAEARLGTYPALADVLTAIEQVPESQVYVLATYTAVLQLRKELSRSGVIKSGF